jgi:glycosyltransferase involved in cell wall biosynthesis
MNIGILCAGPFPPTGLDGMAVYVKHLSNKLTEKGHCVTIVARGSFGVQQESVKAGLRIVRVPIAPLYPFHVHIHGILVNKIIKSLEHRLDILHAHSPYVPAVNTSIPLLTTMHTLERIDFLHYEAKGLRRLAYKIASYVISSMELKLFQNSDMLTAVSSHVFNELNMFYGLEREGAVLGNGVDEETFVPLRDRRKRKKDYVLYVGRMNYRKGLFDLVECAKHVCKERPDVSFVLVGEGPLASSIFRKAAEAGIRKNITFTGFVSRERLKQLYQNCSVLALPSHYEGLPTVMLEAMACGIPVVATRIGGHTDVISDGLNGFLVPVRAPKEMVEPILKLLDDENLNEEIGRAARDTIEKDYTWDRISEKVLKCYDMLC